MKKFILVMLLLSVGLLAACTPAVVEGPPVVDEPPVVEEPAYVLIHNPFTDYGVDLQLSQIKFVLYVEHEQWQGRLRVKQVSAHLVEEVRLYPNGVIEIHFHFVPDTRIYIYTSEHNFYEYTAERVNGYVYTSTDHVGYGWGLLWF